MVSDKLKKKILQVVGDGPITDEFLRDVDLEINRNPVTGMPDGRQLSNDLEGIVKHDRRKRNYNPENDKTYKTYIAMIDIDDFGVFNKNYGQETGDKVLINVNEIISRTLREDDVVKKIRKDPNNYHTHGEEMVALYQCNNYEDAEKVAQRLREEVKQESKNNDPKLKVTISVGLTEYDYAEKPETALARADRYMQIAKRLGKDTVYAGEIAPFYNIVDYICKEGMLERLAKKMAETPKKLKGFVAQKLTQADKADKAYKSLKNYLRKF